MSRPGLALATAFVSVALSLVAGELLLRVAGPGPLAFRGVDGAEPWYRPHAQLGWEHVPGRFPVAGAPATFLGDGRRASGPAPARGPAVVLVGGSFTEGYGVADEETFAWKLQERLPDRVVLNLGTGGYGTLQALLQLRSALPRLDADPAVTGLETVVYGFMWHHPLRNVAHAAWRKQLQEESRGSAGSTIRVPWASLDAQGRLALHPPEPWPLLGPSTRSALVHLLAELWVRGTTRGRLAQSFAVTLALLERMNAGVAAHGGRLLVASLYAPPRQARPLTGFLEARGIPFVDCSPTGYGDPSLRDPDTGHPTAVAHTGYASCLEAALRALRERERPAGAGEDRPTA